MDFCIAYCTVVNTWGKHGEHEIIQKEEAQWKADGSFGTADFMLDW